MLLQATMMLMLMMVMMTLPPPPLSPAWFSRPVPIRLLLISYWLDSHWSSIRRFSFPLPLSSPPLPPHSPAPFPSPLLFISFPHFSLLSITFLICFFTFHYFPSYVPLLVLFFVYLYPFLFIFFLQILIFPPQKINLRKPASL